MPYEIKNGILTGTIEVPIDEASAFAILKYCDLSGYTANEIAAMTGKNVRNIYEAQQHIKRNEPMKFLSHEGTGRKKGQKNIKLEDVENRGGFQGKIRNLMIANHETYNSLAKALGVSNDAVRRWCVEGRYPTTDNMKKIADHYHVQTAWLMGETKNPLRRF